jgi:response regulator of citrate/malate metabolism
MEIQKDLEERDRAILEFLEEHPRGSTIEEVAEAIDVSRVTASKYLQVLAAKDLVDVREIGRAKLHYISDSGQTEKGDLQS